MATNIFDTSKNTINVTSVTNENVYGFDDSKNKIDVTGNLITEIVPTVGQTYYVDGIECVCFYSNPASGDKLRVYSKNGQIHIIEAIKVSSGSVFKFIDKNHDLSYYTCGYDYKNATLPITAYTYGWNAGSESYSTSCKVPRYGFHPPLSNPYNVIKLQDNAKDATDYLINKGKSNESNLENSSKYNDIGLVLNAFRNSHSDVWCLPYSSDFIFINSSWLSNVTEASDYLTSYIYSATNVSTYLTYKVFDISQSTETTKNQIVSTTYEYFNCFLNYRVRLSAEF